MYFLEARNISKTYANHLALDNVSISIPQNSIFGLLGPNGAGKTTLIRIINQITGPDSGEILLQGKKLSREDISRIGYLPEERGLYRKMKVGEQAIYLARLKGLSRSEALKKLKYWFEKFEIQPWWNKKVEELSKGMQQKVQFIVTILHNPSLLIFDEPFSGFDPINANLLKNEIRNLKNQGATIIFSTHNMGSVEELCDHITLISNGKAVISGNVNDIRYQHRDNIVRIEYSDNSQKIKTIISNNYQIESSQKNNGYESLLIKMPQDSNATQLLHMIIGKCHIHSYQEVLPSMSGVFIKVVDQNKTNL